MSEIIKVIILSFSSVIILFLLTKIIGSREISQLSMFDYINSITIGSIAAEMAINVESNFLHTLTAMIIYTIMILLFAFLSNKSVILRRYINGTSLILYNNGMLYKQNFKKAKLDLNEFLISCRNKGYFNLADINTAILEPNGQISIIPIASEDAVKNKNLNINSEQEEFTYNVILDGKIIEKNLSASGKNMNWLNKKLKEQKISDINDIFLATCDKDSNLSIYLKKAKIPSYLV
ncbi:MAG: DUF421 domain-containing protein [Clostridia bacterium]|nr:DUF421 domain-containing protein [Clostridia bacterium]